MQYQKEHHLRFGEAAMRLGLISEADLQFALSRQFAYAYLRQIPGEARVLSEELVSAFQPFSSRVEQLRAIRSQLMLRWFDRAEATLMLRGNKIYADATDTDMYAAIDALTDKLDRCVKKHKEKVSDHHAEEVIKARSSS